MSFQWRGNVRWRDKFYRKMKDLDAEEDGLTRNDEVGI